MSIPWVIYAFIFIELLFVTYLDIKYRVIKNFWSLINIIFAIILFISFPDLYPVSVETFQFTIVFIFAGFMLFMLKIMGGGDSKFLATVFLLIPLKFQDEVFYYLLISTVIIGSIAFIQNLIINWSKIIEGIKAKEKGVLKNYFGRKFPYAPVILLSWVWFGWKTYL